MNKIRFAVLSIVAGLALPVLTACAGVPAEIEALVPNTINYQGRLMRAEPDPQTLESVPYPDGSYTFDVRLYRSISATPANAVWGGSYTTYVRGGYFNIMLGGDTGGPLTGAEPTYTHNLLWKAFWPDPDTNPAERNTLYLGVTLDKTEDGQYLSPGERVELSPRQNLLAAPYAFRAQIAEYARRAAEHFEIEGTLSAKDILIDAPEGATWLSPLLSSETQEGTTRRILSLGQGTSGHSHVKIEADEVLLRSGSFIRPSKITLDALGNSTASHVSGIELKTTGAGGSITLTTAGASGDINITASRKANLTGTTGATITGGSGQVRLEGGTIVGQNALSWNNPSETSAYAKPFAVSRFPVTIPANVQATSFTTSWPYAGWSAMIVGIHSGNSSTSAGDALQTYYMHQSGTVWGGSIRRDTTATTARTYSIEVLFINKHFVSDGR